MSSPQLLLNSGTVSTLQRGKEGRRGLFTEPSWKTQVPSNSPNVTRQLGGLICFKQPGALFLLPQLVPLSTPYFFHETSLERSPSRSPPESSSASPQGSAATPAPQPCPTGYSVPGCLRRLCRFPGDLHQGINHWVWAGGTALCFFIAPLLISAVPCWKLLCICFHSHLFSAVFSFPRGNGRRRAHHCIGDALVLPRVPLHVLL